MSTSKFAQGIFDEAPKTRHIGIYFEPADTFFTKFNSLAVKPIGISIQGTGKTKPKNFNHQEILDKFNGCQPIVCFKSKPFNFELDKTRKLQKFIIEGKKHAPQGYEYYPIMGVNQVDGEQEEQILAKKVEVNDRPPTQWNHEQMFTWEQ